MHSLNSLKSKKIIVKADKQLRHVVISSSLSWNNMDAMAGQQTAHWDQMSKFILIEWLIYISLVSQC